MVCDQAVNGGVQKARGWSELLTKQWTSNKAAADERWRQRQESLAGAPKDKADQQGEDTDWRHRRVHADWRNLQNGTSHEPEDWRHMHVHADWRNLIPAEGSADANSSAAAADAAATGLVSAGNVTAGAVDAGSEEAEGDGQGEDEEESEEEAAAASLAERREELRREMRHQRYKDIRSHRSGLTGHLHTHEH